MLTRTTPAYRLTRTGGSVRGTGRVRDRFRDGDNGRRLDGLGSRRSHADRVNLTDRSDPAVKQAVREAFDTSLRGAVAVGFSCIRVDAIQVLEDHGGSGDGRDGRG